MNQRPTHTLWGDKSRIRYVDGVPVVSKRKAPSGFMAINWQQLEAMSALLPRGSKLPITLIAIIGLCQCVKSRKVRLMSKWYSNTGLHKNTVLAHVKKLESLGVLTVVREPGKALIIQLSELVPLREWHTKDERKSRNGKKRK